jgi:hypothetical protein
MCGEDVEEDDAHDCAVPEAIDNEPTAPVPARPEGAEEAEDAEDKG